MKRSPFISLIAVCLLCAIVLSSCTLVPQSNSSTPGSTPTATPNESTPTESTPAESTPTESTPVASSPTASSPIETPPAESTPSDPSGKIESTPTEPSSSETTPPEETLPPELDPDAPDPLYYDEKYIYTYTSLPDAFTELTADTRAAIETALGSSVNWDKHYLGTHKGYIIVGTYDASNPKIFKSYDRYFGRITNLYAYRNGTLYTFRDLLDRHLFCGDRHTYISYLALRKEIDSLPVASNDLSAEVLSKIKESYKNFESSYYGMCGGYVIFGYGGNIADGYRGGIRQLQNHVILDFMDVYAYSTDKGFEDFFTVCNENLDIDYNDIVDTILIAALDGMKYWIHPKYMINE